MILKPKVFADYFSALAHNQSKNKVQSRNVFLVPIPYSLFFGTPLPPPNIFYNPQNLADYF